MSEPTLVTISGRPASFNSGGKFFIPVPQSLGTVSIDMAAATARRSTSCRSCWATARFAWTSSRMVSELDYANATTIAGTHSAGHQDSDGRHRGGNDGGTDAGHRRLGADAASKRRTAACPGSARCPTWAWRSAKSTRRRNEVELLILVTPELVEPLDADEVPPCGPGMQTTSPSDWELFMKGHLEVPSVSAGRRRVRRRLQAPAATMPSGPPPDGMIQDPASGFPPRSQADGGARSRPQNRYSPAKPNSAASATVVGTARMARRDSSARSAMT